MKLKTLLSLVLCCLLAVPMTAYSYAEDSGFGEYEPSCASDNFANVPLEAKKGEDIFVDVYVKNSKAVEGLVCNINFGYSYMRYVQCISYKGNCFANAHLNEITFSSLMTDGGIDLQSETKIARFVFNARKSISKSDSTFSYSVKEFYGTSMQELNHSNVVMKFVSSNETPFEHIHTIVIDKRVEPTCTKTGLTEGKHCSECNDIIVAQEVIPMINHKYQNGKCVYCGADDPNYKLYTGKKIYGDANRDGNITSEDSLLILRQSVKLENFDNELIKLSDVNEDGSVTSLDSLEVLRCSVKLATKTKAGQEYLK